MSTIAKLNKIWKDKTGRDLTTEEAWKMVELAKMIYENADRNLDIYNHIADTHGKEVADKWVMA